MIFSDWVFIIWSAGMVVLMVLFVFVMRAAVQADYGRYKKPAKRRAEKLLKRHLSPQQRRQWRWRKRFTVIGSQGGRYTLKRGKYGNVHATASDHRHRYCAYSPRVPVCDSILMQKLVIETDEAAFLRKANPFRTLGGY